jgi:hypothetical protein
MAELRTPPSPGEAGRIGAASAVTYPGWRRVDIPTAADGRGILCFAEGDCQVPFPIERVYWIYGIPGDTHRGRHAHRHVQELVVAAAGEFDVHCDNGTDRDTRHLDSPSCGLLVDPGVWKELDAFSPGAVCLVLASGVYEEDEYERDYSKFMTAARTPLPAITRLARGANGSRFRAASSAQPSPDLDSA